MKRNLQLRSSLRILLALAVIVLSGQLLFGQATTGTLKGTVIDPNGAFVPGATVTCRNQATGVESPNATTNETGSFVIPNLLPGPYSLTVSAATDFRKKTISDIKVRLGLDTEVRIDLEIGLPEETVTVSANQAEVVETNSQISSNFDAKKVLDLPSNAAGSGIDTLALAAAGVTQGIGSVNTNGTSLSVNGNRAYSNNFTINGMDNNDLSISGPSFHVGNAEIVQEYQIITNNFSAQYGRNQGAVINIVTKGGTNSYHGAAYEYHRNSSLLDAMTNIERRDPDRSKRDKFISNVFGGVLGGPVIKERLFFFGSYQGVIQRENFTSRSDNLAILPSEFARLQATFPGNQMIQVITNQSAFALNNFGTVRPRADRGTDRVCISATPQTNCVAGDESGYFAAAFPEREFPAPYDQNEITGRLDWFMSPDDSATISYLWQDSVLGNSISRWPFPPGQSNGFTGDQVTNSRNLSGFYTRQISNSVANTIQATFQQISDDWGGGCSDPLTGCVPLPTEIGEAFTITVFGLTGQNNPDAALQNIGPYPLWPQGRTVGVYQVSDRVSWIKSNHAFLFGADVRYLKNTVTFLPRYNGVFYFLSAESVANNAPHFVIVNDGEPTLHFKQLDQFYYIQDDWKILPNLTLNLGFRYEYSGQPLNLLHKITTEREGNPDTAYFDQSLPLEARTVPAIPSDGNNFAPRIGFAWSPDFGKSRFSRLLFGEQFATVIRGGYSIAYDPVFYNIMLNVSTQAPMSFLNFLSGDTAIPLPANPTGSNVRAAASAYLSRNTVDPRTLVQTQVSDDFHLPRIMQYSLGIQRQIGQNNVIEIRYVGNRQNDLFQTVNRNPAYANLYYGFTANVPGLGLTNFPSFRELLPAGIQAPDPESGRLIPGRGLIRSIENTGDGRYDGLQIRYNGRLFNNSLIVGASYTFSKTFDNASDLYGWGESPLSQNPFDYEAGERGLSELDRRNSLAVEFSYELPFRRDQRGLVGKLIGGWQVSGIYNLADGESYTPLLILNSNYLGSNLSYEDTDVAGSFIGGDNFRPFVGNINAPVTQAGISQIDFQFINFLFPNLTCPISDPSGFFSFNEIRNGNCVSVGLDDVRYIFNGPGAARIFGTPFGNALRNFERGPKLNNLNLAIFKTTNINERIKVQFRFEAYNFLNHPNRSFGVSQGAYSPGSIYLKDAGGSFAKIDEANLSSRRIQLGIRVTF